MILYNKKTDICDLCGEKCVEAYWIEIMNKNGEVKDWFVCMGCYMKIKKASQKPCSEGGHNEACHVGEE